MIYTTKDICDLQIASNCGNFFPKSNNCDYKVTLLTSGRRFKVFIGMRLNSRKILVIYIHDRIQNSNHNNICFESKSGIFFSFHTRDYILSRKFSFYKSFNWLCKRKFSKTLSGLFTRGRNNFCQIKNFHIKNLLWKGKNNSLYKLRKDIRKPQSKSWVREITIEIGVSWTLKKCNQNAVRFVFYNKFTSFSFVLFSKYFSFFREPLILSRRYNLSCSTYLTLGISLSEKLGTVVKLIISNKNEHALEMS